MTLRILPPGPWLSRNGRTDEPARDRPGRRTFLRGAAGLTWAAAGGVGFRARAHTVDAPRASVLASGEASLTARSAALHRAVHQIVDLPSIFVDPYALAILGPLASGELQRSLDRGSRGMRASIALRSRYAEDCLGEAASRGVRQYVVLGAGLDTFACRNPHAALGLHVYEVDHPATQALKRRRLSDAAIPVHDGTHFVPIDFETQTLRDALAAAGFRFDRPAFFSMLGVSIYISDEAVMGTMRTVAECASGSEIAFSFSVPEDMLSEAARLRRRRTVAAMAAAGEPWINFYEPRSLADRLRAERFSAAQVLAPNEANRRYFSGRRDGLSVADAHMMLARV